MVTRLWRGRTAPHDADAYEEHLRTEVLPGLREVEGHRGAYVLRRAAGDGVEFVVLTLFDSMDAVRAFAGEEPEVAVISPRAEELLSDFDRTAAHYEAVVEPDPTGRS